jgi:hypothetical protein
VVPWFATLRVGGLRQSCKWSASKAAEVDAEHRHDKHLASVVHLISSNEEGIVWASAALTAAAITVVWHIKQC